MGENILIVHGGGPTSVINASLYGAVKEAKKYKEIEHIYAAKNFHITAHTRICTVEDCGSDLPTDQSSHS